MKTWMERMRVWRLRKQQRSLDRWVRVRAKGKARFVVESALSLSLIMIAVTAIRDYFFDSGIHFPRFLYKSVYFVLGGVLIGFVSWWTMEGRYRNADRSANQNRYRTMRFEHLARSRTSAWSGLAMSGLLC
jgi:hypothetical protein